MRPAPGQPQPWAGQQQPGPPGQPPAFPGAPPARPLGPGQPPPPGAPGAPGAPAVGPRGFYGGGPPPQVRPGGPPPSPGSGPPGQFPPGAALPPGVPGMPGYPAGSAPSVGPPGPMLGPGPRPPGVGPSGPGVGPIQPGGPPMPGPSPLMRPQGPRPFAQGQVPMQQQRPPGAMQGPPRAEQPGSSMPGPAVSSVRPPMPMPMPPGMQPTAAAQHQQRPQPPMHAMHGMNLNAPATAPVHMQQQQYPVQAPAQTSQPSTPQTPYGETLKATAAGPMRRVYPTANSYGPMGAGAPPLGVPQPPIGGAMGPGAPGPPPPIGGGVVGGITGAIKGAFGGSKYPSMDGMQHNAMSMPGQTSPTGARIDPSQIPRPAQHDPDTAMVFETRVNGAHNPPPPCSTTFIVRDTGNCSPHVMRSTLNTIPYTAELLSTSCMPLAVVLQPLAADPNDEPIPVVDFGESGPVRCSRCKAYINPFFRWTDQGRSFVCNLCGSTTETPRDYFCNLGADGRRRDAEERPELMRGSVEFVASKEFMVPGRPPMTVTYFFLIDVSAAAVASGATAAACSAISQALDDLPAGERSLVGVATYDTSVHFYNLKPTLSQAQMLVVPDINDMYCPIPKFLVVPLGECKELIQRLCEGIPAMFASTRIGESAMGAAIQGALCVLKDQGGRVMVFQSVRPSVGPGACPMRDADKAMSGDRETKLFAPVDNQLGKLAQDCAECQLSIDLFLTCGTNVDIASLSVVPRVTGGQVYYYYPFNPAQDSAKLFNDVRWNVVRPQGFEAIMRVRCSSGLSVVEYMGNYCKRNAIDVDLPAVDCDKTFTVTFKHDDKLSEHQEVCLQCALLYTTIEGERRIRIHTLSLPATSVLANCFRGADLDAQFTHMCRHAVQQVPSSPLQTVRENMTAQTVAILHAYRKYCATASSTGQLILPEALKLLPLYSLALFKSTGLRNEVRVDERLYWLSRIWHLPAAMCVPMVYPRLLALHQMPSKEETARGVLPPVLSLSSEKLDHDGLFLLENSDEALLWVGRAANPEALQQVFGAPTVDHIKPNMFVLQMFNNDLSRQVHDVLNEVRRQRASYLRLRLAKRADPSEALFFAQLIEDRTQSGMSYVEYLCHIHRLIQNKMG
eukprot:jgi/Chlat1/1294/Chrsp118S01733